MSTPADGAGDVEAWCEVMHDAYEDAAKAEGWETQERSRKPWSDVPEANKATMRAAVRALASVIFADAKANDESLRQVAMDERDTTIRVAAQRDEARAEADRLRVALGKEAELTEKPTVIVSTSSLHLTCDEIRKLVRAADPVSLADVREEERATVAEEVERAGFAPLAQQIRERTVMDDPEAVTDRG